MTHLSNHTPIFRASLRTFLLLPLAGLALSLASCTSESEPPSVPVTDTRPVGNGLKTIGYALLGGAVVVVLGSLAKR